MRRGPRAATAATVLAGTLAAALWLWPPPATQPPALERGGAPPTAGAAAAPSRTLPPEQPTPAATPGTPALPDVQAAAAGILARRNAALRSGNRLAWLADVDPGDPRLRQREAAVFDTLTRIPFDRYITRLDGAVRPAGRGAWIGRLVVTERVDGFDATPATYTRTVRFGWRGERLVLLRSQPPQRGAQPWELGATQVIAGRRTLLVGAGPRARIRQVIARADAAAGYVAEVWPAGWTRRVVVYLPRTQRDMSRLLGGGPIRDLDQIAAVTATHGERARHRLPVRVVVNPKATAALDGEGLEALLRHEITHVATGTGQDRVPIWLSEGLADYFAYEPLDLPVAVVADDLLDRARRDGPPARLPTWSDFAARSSRLAEAYAGAWLAVRILVEDHGEAAVIRMYRAAKADGAQRALVDELGVTQGQLLEDWQAQIEELTGG